MEMKIVVATLISGKCMETNQLKLQKFIDSATKT